MIKERIDGLGEFEFYKSYFIGRIDEGSNAGADFVDNLSALIQKHYSGQPIIYISDRVNSYSIDPVATMDLISRNNICYAGIVTYEQQQMDNYPYEEKTIRGVSMRQFNSLDSAVTWAEEKAMKLI